MLYFEFARSCKYTIFAHYGKRSAKRLCVQREKTIKTDILVIGAGAAGLMFGSHIKSSAIFADANSYFGAKIKISGGGKCNFTNQNISPKNYSGDSDFIEETLKHYTNSDTLDFLTKFGIEPNIYKNGQFFCKSSLEILNAFKFSVAHHKFLFDKVVKNVCFANDEFVTEFEDMKINSKKLVVASGGVSYLKLNASDIGYKIAQIFGHGTKTQTPALVGLTLQKEQFWMKNLSGVSLRVKIKCGDFAYEDDLLFSHRGVSGPAVLNTSLRWKNGSIEIDFLPHFKLKNDIWNDKRQPSSIFPAPKSFIKAFLNSVEIADKPMKHYTQNEKNSIVKLKNYTFSPAGTFGFSKAEVTKGGVRTDNITPITFESKLQRGLYFIGEVLDVTGELGGYNIQWAFSSGASAARHLKL